MGRAEFNTFCKSLPRATHVVQWGGSDVWKIGGKVFAIASFDQGDGAGISFKVSALAFEILKEQPGCRGAPYLASRGMTWIQRTSGKSMPDSALKDYLRASYALVAAGLSKKVRLELRLDEDAQATKLKAKAPKSRGKS